MLEQLQQLGDNLMKFLQNLNAWTAKFLEDAQKFWRCRHEFMIPISAHPMGQLVDSNSPACQVRAGWIGWYGQFLAISWLPYEVGYRLASCIHPLTYLVLCFKWNSSLYMGCFYISKLGSESHSHAAPDIRVQNHGILYSTRSHIMTSKKFKDT